MRQAAAVVVAIVQHHSLQAAVQNVDSETQKLHREQIIDGLQRVLDSPFSQVFDSPVLLGFGSAGFGNLPAAGFVGHVPAVILAAALQRSGNAAS